MDLIIDKELIGKGTSVDGTISDPFTDGLYLIGISKEQVENFGTFVNDLYQKIRDTRKKQVTRNAVTMLQGAIFAIGTNKQHNPEWKEHCASSLREIFHEWSEGQLESDFVKFYKNEGEKLASNESEVFKEFRQHYQYFTGIDHHNASTIQGSLIALLKNNALKLEDCYKDDIFIERVKTFFSKLSEIQNFAVKKTNSL
ncbi:MAG: hypothetical protein HY453_01205 [Parcubacteria group bacterium]|nr:hypothetical protein [Parcubacteria group bacterium]